MNRFSHKSHTAVCMYLKIIVPTAPHKSQESQIGDHHTHCVHTLCLPPFSWSRTFLFLIIPPSNLLPQAQCQSPSSFSVANLCSSAKTRGGPSSCSSAERAVLWDFFLLFFWYLLNLVGRHGEAWGSHRSTVRQRESVSHCCQVRASPC